MCHGRRHGRSCPVRCAYGGAVVILGAILFVVAVFLSSSVSALLFPGGARRLECRHRVRHRHDGVCAQQARTAAPLGSEHRRSSIIRSCNERTLATCHSHNRYPRQCPDAPFTAPFRVYKVSRSRCARPRRSLPLLRGATTRVYFMCSNLQTSLLCEPRESFLPAHGQACGRRRKHKWGSLNCTS
jgi:hypothetical protein